MAHGAPKSNFNKVTSTKVKDERKSNGKAKVNEVVQEPSPSYTTEYMVTMNHHGKLVVKYVGAYTKKFILRSVGTKDVFV